MAINKQNFIIGGSVEKTPLKVEIKKQNELSEEVLKKVSQKTAKEIELKEKSHAIISKAISEKIKTSNDFLPHFIKLLNFIVTIVSFIPKILIVAIVSSVLWKTLCYVFSDNFPNKILSSLTAFINGIEKEVVFVILIFAILSLLFKIKLPHIGQIKKLFNK